MPTPAEPDHEPTVRGNVFATGPTYKPKSRQLRDMLERQRRAMGMTFQRGTESLIPHHADGTRATDYAMDESDFSQAKLTRSSGGYLPLQQLEFFAAQGFIGYQLCAILSQNWLIDKVCGVPAQDAVRNGFDIHMNDGEKLDPEVLQAFRLADKRINIKAKTREFIKKRQIFGVRHALFVIKGIDYEAPFNADGIKPGSYQGISQIDPQWIAPVLDGDAASNPASPDFYEPTWWMVGGRRIHKSHFIISRAGGEVVDLLKPSYYYGGIPIPQKIFNRVYAAERTADEAPMLAMSKRLMTLSTDTTQWFGPESKADAHMQEFMELMNNFGTKVIGTEETMQQFETSLQGMDETILTQYQLVCAAGNVPITKIMGTSPKGMDATGEFDEANYHEELESLQSDAATPFVERHHLCLWRSVIAPKFKQDIKRGTEIHWNPTDSMTAKELAELNKLKSDTDTAYVNGGVLDALDVRGRLINDPGSGYNGIEEIVPEGPGDRDAAAEAKKTELEGPKDDKEKDSAQDEASAAGILFQAGNKILLMKRRSERTNGGVWSVPAGKIEAGETVLQGACREFGEETGKKISRATFAWGDDRFALFAVHGEEFVPTMCDEHSAYGWFAPTEIPHPLHPGLAEQIELVTGEAVPPSPFESAMDVVKGAE